MNAKAFAIGFPLVAVFMAGCGDAARQPPSAVGTESAPSSRPPAPPQPAPGPADSPKPAAKTTTFTFAADCPMASLEVPAGYKTSTASHAKCTVWLSDEIHLGGRMSVATTSPKHQIALEALQGQFGFHKVVAGSHTWHIAIPDPHDAFEDSFEAILILDTTAVLASGVGTGWKEEGLKQFLSGVKLRAR